MQINRVDVYASNASSNSFVEPDNDYCGGWLLPPPCRSQEHRGPLRGRRGSLSGADASHLNRLWFLLLDNAIKYTPSGGKIVVRACTDATGAPVCEIADTGIGIEPRDLPNIFDRFFRAENARLTADVGSGLGLAIAQWIVDVHEASLSVESALGAGSTFRVKFRPQKQPLAADGMREDLATSLVGSAP